MADWVAETTEYFDWVVRDLNGDPVTGLTGTDFTITLRKSTDSTSWVPASESVTVSETGGGGYRGTLTLDSDSGMYDYYWAEVVEKATIPLSSETTHDIFKTVNESPDDSVVEDDAFCGVADVEIYWGRGLFSTDTVPTRAQVLILMKRVAEELEAAMDDEGADYTPANGSSPIDTGTRSGRILGGLLREANAVKAAGVAMAINQAADLGGQAADEAIAMLGLYAEKEQRVRDFVKQDEFEAESYKHVATANSDDDELVSVDDLEW